MVHGVERPVPEGVETNTQSNTQRDGVPARGTRPDIPPKVLVLFHSSLFVCFYGAETCADRREAGHSLSPGCHIVYCRFKHKQ